MSNFVNIFCHWVRNLRPLKENVIDRIVIDIANDTILAITNSNYRLLCIA